MSDVDWAPYLDNDEELIWEGQPRGGWWDSARTLTLFLFLGVALCVSALMAILGIAELLSTGRPDNAGAAFGDEVQPISKVAAFPITCWLWCYAVVGSRGLRRKARFAITHRRMMVLVLGQPPRLSTYDLSTRTEAAIWTVHPLYVGDGPPRIPRKRPRDFVQPLNTYYRWRDSRPSWPTGPQTSLILHDLPDAAPVLHIVRNLVARLRGMQS
ncbi:MAG: hypothetical protein AAF771_08370 [Pseudomonadota bacterium]